jgi:hypothetical protein
LIEVAERQRSDDNLALIVWFRLARIEEMIRCGERTFRLGWPRLGA